MSVIHFSPKSLGSFAAVYASAYPQTMWENAVLDATKCLAVYSKLNTQAYNAAYIHDYQPAIAWSQGSIAEDARTFLCYQPLTIHRDFWVYKRNLPSKACFDKAAQFYVLAMYNLESVQEIPDDLHSIMYGGSLVLLRFYQGKVGYDG